MDNNIENKIKKEFQDREIKPSKSAWEVLNAQLEVTSTKKENKKLKFLAYAAVFIGLLFGLLIFLNGNKVINNKPVIVDVNEDVMIEIPTDRNQTIDESQKIDTKIIEKKNEVVAIQKFKKAKKIDKQIRSPKKKVIPRVQHNIKVANNDIKSEEIRKINEKDNISDQTQITKVELANINSNVINETNNKSKKVKKKLFSSDEDIDLLLANALKSDTNKTIKEIKIQTAYLQYSVESEINTPIGNKILKTLKAGVDTVEEYITSNN